MSHTVSTQVKVRDEGVLQRALQRIAGAEVLGKGRHKLYQDAQHEGFAFQLKDWRFPVILTENEKGERELKFDNYGGEWGRQQDLDKVLAEYGFTSAEEYAAQQGWVTQREPDALVVMKPDGARITLIDAGGGEVKIDTTNTVGATCEIHNMALAEAMGSPGLGIRKPEYQVEKAHVSIPEQQ